MAGRRIQQRTNRKQEDKALGYTGGPGGRSRGDTNNTKTMGPHDSSDFNPGREEEAHRGESQKRRQQASCLSNPPTMSSNHWYLHRCLLIGLAAGMFNSGIPYVAMAILRVHYYFSEEEEDNQQQKASNTDSLVYLLQHRILIALSYLYGIISVLTPIFGAWCLTSSGDVCAQRWLLRLGRRRSDHRYSPAVVQVDDNTEDDERREGGGDHTTWHSRKNAAWAVFVIVSFVQSGFLLGDSLMGLIIYVLNGGDLVSFFGCVRSGEVALNVMMCCLLLIVWAFTAKGGYLVNIAPTIKEDEANTEPCVYEQEDEDQHFYVRIV